MNDTANVFRTATSAPDALAISRQYLSDAENALVDMMQLLTSKKRKYVDGVLSGKSKKDAYTDAGYTLKTHIPAMVNRVMKDKKVSDALELGAVINQMQNGVHTYYKRDKTIQVIETCSNPESEQFSGGVTIQALKYLSDLDGDIVKHQATANSQQPVQIVINTGMPGRIGVDGQVLTHNDTDNVDNTRQLPEINDLHE